MRPRRLCRINKGVNVVQPENRLKPRAFGINKRVLMLCMMKQNESPQHLCRMNKELNIM